jgi:hypothetical protein
MRASIAFRDEDRTTLDSESGMTATEPQVAAWVVDGYLLPVDSVEKLQIAMTPISRTCALQLTMRSANRGGNG